VVNSKLPLLPELGNIRVMVDLTPKTFEHTSRVNAASQNYVFGSRTPIYLQNILYLLFYSLFLVHSNLFHRACTSLNFLLFNQYTHR